MKADGKGSHSTRKYFSFLHFNPAPAELRYLVRSRSAYQLCDQVHCCFPCSPSIYMYNPLSGVTALLSLSNQVQSRKTLPCLIERLLTVQNELNQTNKQIFIIHAMRRSRKFCQRGSNFDRVFFLFFFSLMRGGRIQIPL